MATKIKNETAPKLDTAAAETPDIIEAKVRVRVLITFRDKYTQAIRKKGDELEITTERLAELTKPKKYVQKVR